MKKIMMILVLILVSISMTACGNKSVSADNESTHKRNEYKNISPSEAKERLMKEEGIILLDVRTEEEYQEKHIPQSILIPLDVLEKEARNKLPDKDTVIFVYCRSGRRSVNASEILVKLGYTNIYNLGGIQDWPYDTE